MRWDVFCRVIDNHGDAGVCWRLVRRLASTGEQVRLWIDDPGPLAWMAPGGHSGVTVIDWGNGDAVLRACEELPPDVIVEAFGCEPAPDLLERVARDGSSHATRQWVNLEYLSAEPYVERLHGLPSPVWRGPGEGLTKYFYYPGFTDKTGGLLREGDLLQRRAQFERGPWLARHGVPWQGERLVSLFCYEPAALPALLAQFERSSVPTRLLVTAGRASLALPPGPDQRGALSITRLPRLSQDDYDALLWSCDLNFVRGEDSLVRALWAGSPFVWNIYEQDDGIHHEKLDAFLDWLGASDDLREFHRAWNGADGASLPEIDLRRLAEWTRDVLRARGQLLGQTELVDGLKAFLDQKR